MKSIIKLLIFVIISTFLISSCVSPKEITYFQDKGRDTTLISNQRYNIIFHSGDIITITVTAMDMDAVMPFNMPVVAHSMDGRISGQQALQNYLIDMVLK